MQQLPLGVRLPDRAVFASFLPARNREALAHAELVAAGEATGATWICGPASAGKSICCRPSARRRPRRGARATFRWRSSRRSVSACWKACRSCSASAWTTSRRSPAAWNGRRPSSVCCAKSRSAAARWSWRHGRRRRSLGWALPDLGSRCAAGAVLQLRPLDEAEQQQALQLRARLRGFELPEETSRWLQRRFPRDMRRLYELLDTLDEAALAAQRRLTVPFIREVLHLP